MSKILDRFGNPIERQALTEPQTARLSSLHWEYADHPSRGLTPPKLARILEAAEQGDIKAQCELFEDMEEKDAHIFAEMSKRKRALLTVGWDILPPRNASAAEKQRAEYVKELLLDLADFEDVIFDALDAIGKGFSAQEIEWQLLGREWLPKAIHFRPPTWFKLNPGNQEELRLRDDTAEGAALQSFGWILHQARAKSGYVARGGLHRILAWPYLFKNYSVRDLAEFLEIYGLPLRVGTYPPGAGDKEKATLLQAVVNIGHAAAGIIPEGMMIDFKEAAKGSHDPFQAMMDWCERSQSKAILGGTLTSQADGKSSTNALGNVHNEVRHDLLESDARQLGATLTRDLVYPLLALNKGGVDPRRLPRLVFDVSEPEDMSLLSEALPKLVGIGMRIRVEDAHERLGWPMAQEGEAVLGAASEPAPEKPAAARAALKATANAEDGAGATVDAYTDQLSGAAAAALDGLIAPVRDLVMSAQSLEDIRDGLITLYGQGPVDDLAMVMARAIMAAELAGRFETKNPGL